MTRLRRGTVLEVLSARPGVLELAVSVAGVHARAIAYLDLVGEPKPGDTVILNTAAVELRLGSGGTHFVVAIEDREFTPDLPAHTMKLRYTPSQTAVPMVEETHREAIDAVDSLQGMPVVVAGLHSALKPAVIGARATAPGARIAYVMTDAGALVAGFSETVAALKKTGAIAACITAGQATGGDLEAVTIYGALAAARAVVNADIAIVAMGPGNLGTGSRWGSASLEVASLVDAAAAMGARAIVAPRLSFADARERHRGISHHTLTALGLMHARATVALPSADDLPDERSQLERLAEDHDIVEVPVPESVQRVLSESGISTMGRTYEQDPHYFHAAAAAGIYAATCLR
jgi:hypothetical protein